MENRRIEKVMYMKFNNQSKRGSLLEASEKGIVVIDKPFKEVLKEEIEKEYKKSFDYSFNYEPMKKEPKIELIWLYCIHKNHINQKGRNVTC